MSFYYPVLIEQQNVTPEEEVNRQIWWKVTKDQ